MLEENRSERNRFTRMNLGEAIIALMQKKDYDKITVSEIAQKAGVSRMTYYNYFETKEDVLSNYLEEIVLQYVEESDLRADIGVMLEYKHILFSLEYLDQYASFFLTLSKAGFYSTIIDAVNDFMYKEFKNTVNIYELYCYAGALINLFIKWEENRDEMSAEEVAQIISKFLRPGVKVNL